MNEIKTAGAARGDKSDRTIVLANAPVSFGAFEITVGVDPNVPDGLRVLDQVAEAGYRGIDLGPAGYLGEGKDLARRLADRKLGLAGGYLELPYSEPSRMPAALHELDILLDVFDVVGTLPGGLKPKPTLADLGSDIRKAHPGQAADNRALGFNEDGWKRFADGLERVVGRCRERGYEPTFHHETGTHIEAAWEIEKMLELTSIDLCLDTGHLLLGKGEPVKALRDWGSRINHIHLKDARSPVIDEIVREAAPVMEIWRRGAFCALGRGNVDIEGVLSWIRSNYGGWLVVEQDILPDASAPNRPAEDQVANRRYLAQRGF
jgi:inosose dehydratase